MESRIYQTQDLDFQKIGESLVSEYQEKGFEAQHFGDSNQSIVQLKKENTLRSITGLNKALGISFQSTGNETLVQVGAQDWVDQIAVGAIGLILFYPLLITAAVGAVQQRNVVHDVLDSIDQLVKQQQPHVSVTTPPPTNTQG